MALGRRRRLSRIECVTRAAPSLSQISVLILDGHREARDALAAAFRRDGGFLLLGHTEDAAQAAELSASLHPDIILVDTRSVHRALEACRSLRQASPGSHIVLLSTFFEPGEQRRYEDAGVAAWYLKGEPFRVLAGRLKRLVGAAA